MEEVNDYGALDGSEIAIPDEINGDVAFEERTVVVFECEGLLLKQSQYARGGVAIVG